MAEHASRLLLFARQRSRCEADAEDLVQEAVVEAWHRQDHSGPPPLALVFATIRRRAVDQARRDGRRALREMAAHEDTPECWFDCSFEERERAEAIDKAMRALTDIHREVVTLRIWGHLTFAEIAETLDIPLNTAASRYRYGLAELRKLTREVMA